MATFGEAGVSEKQPQAKPGRENRCVDMIMRIRE
jgi:hypothetical protein